MTRTAEQRAKHTAYMREYMRTYRANRPDVVEAGRVAAREYARKKRSTAEGMAVAVKSMRDWHAANPGVNAERCRKWAKANPEKIQALRERNRLANRLRSRLYSALRAKGLRKRKDCSAVRDLGCTIPELRDHLKNQFTPGMSWDNHGAWHIDHRQPLASFDLSDPDQVRKACHYTNLQPLWAPENQRKHANVDWCRSI